MPAPAWQPGAYHLTGASAHRLDLTEAAPAFMTIIGMPFTSNIAYGFIGGFITWFVTKFFTYQVSLCIRLAGTPC